MSAQRAQGRYTMHAASLWYHLAALIHSHVSCACSECISLGQSDWHESLAFEVPRDVERRSSQILTARSYVPCKAASCIGIKGLHLH